LILSNHGTGSRYPVMASRITGDEFVSKVKQRQVGGLKARENRGKKIRWKRKIAGGGGTDDGNENENLVERLLQPS